MKPLTTLLLSIAFLLASVDINTASAKDFTTLKGIGAKKAEAIVKYRESIKCFKSIDELTNVKGIGKKTLTKNSNDLEISTCKR